jgi:hypothetical protein
MKRKTCSANPVAADQRITDVSKLPDRIFRLSGDMATTRTGPPWPRICAIAVPAMTANSAAARAAVNAARIIASLCIQHRWLAVCHKLWAHKHGRDPIIPKRHDQRVTVQIDHGEHKNKEKRESHADQNRRSCAIVRLTPERLFIQCPHINASASGSALEVHSLCFTGMDSQFEESRPSRQAPDLFQSSAAKETRCAHIGSIREMMRIALIDAGAAAP